MANSLIGVSEASLELGQAQRSADICAALLRDSIPLLGPEDVARSHLTYSNALRKLGRHEEALDAFIAYHELVRHASKDVAEDYARHMAVIMELEKSKGETMAYRRLADELSTAKAAAEAANRSKSEFLSNMSHELRTPLNAVIGFADIIRSEIFGPIPRRYQAYLEDIHRSGEHLLELISQLLDLSKAEAGRMELVEEVVTIDELLSESLLFVRETALAGGIAIEAPPATRLSVRVDPLRIKQCLINVLANAVKFTPRGGRISVTVDTDPGGIGITISDTGIGLAPEDVPKAFERFGQGGNARAVTGTGLGLPLTKQLIELHGGTVHLESVRGIGTSVSFKLPRQRIVSTRNGLPERGVAALSA